MKPLLLKMKSFGPYLDETIDFKKIQNKGIFLITGDTGSGKTTIFDAISVALFGESNGDERTAESFKSDFDVQEDLMKIEFTFELKGREFRIVRVPKQRRKKLKGEGYTEELGQVTLYETIGGEETALDFNREVSAKIQELLGINARQFRQIVMIPQGQFRKLITESSEEREKILKSIFSIHKYEVFQRRLLNLNKDLETKLREQKNLILAEISHIKYDEDSGLVMLLQAQAKNISGILKETLAQNSQDALSLGVMNENLIFHKNNMILLEKQIEVTKRNNELIEAFEQAQKEKNVLEQLKSSFEMMAHKVEMAERAFRIQPLEEFVQLREKEMHAQQALIQIKKEAIKAYEAQEILLRERYSNLATLENMKQLEEDKAQCNFLKSIYPKVKDYEDIQVSLKRVTTQFLEEQGKIAGMNQMFAAISQKQGVLIQEKEALSKHPLNIEKTQALLLDLTKQFEQIQYLEKSCNQYIEALKQLKKSSQGFKQIDEEKEKHQQYWDQQQRLWIEGQAGILAQALKEGDPCPVCGNEHHIKRAIVSHDVPSKVFLEGLKKETRLLEKRFNECQMMKAGDEQNVTNKKEQLQEILESVCEVFQIQLTFDREIILTFCEQEGQKLLLQTDGVKKELEYFRLENTKLDGLNVQLEAFIKKSSELEEEIKRRGVIHLKTIEEKTIKETEVITLEKDLPPEMRDNVIITKQLMTLETRISKLEKEIEASRIELEAVRKQLDIVTATYTEAQMGLEDKKLAFENAGNSFEKALVEGQFKDRTQFEQMKLTQPDIQALKAELNMYSQKVQLNLQNLLKLSHDVKDLVRVDLTDLLEQKKVLEGMLEALTKKQILIQVRIEENKKQVLKIEDIHEKINDFTEQQALVCDLSQVANGSSSGASKITFERYILASFLQEIVDAANVRFHKMSNSRYELLRKNLSSDKRKHAGLDLEVFDYYTGKARDINTLSGGEGFKASLALALGLADIAQAYSGGISLDTMFVDEGFGSLSSESLDHAINCLMDLKEGGRLVGIISHVQELKDRIDARLVVEKQKTGSRTYFEGV